jgi:RND family efflux transporter MFP subunit
MTRVGVAVLGLAIASCSDREPAPAPAPRPAQPSRDAAVADGPTRLIGVLTAARSVEIASRVAGLLARVHVGAGDLVTEGQVVAEMDPVQLRDDLRAAEASLAAATAASRSASIDLEDARRKLAVETRAVEGGVSPAQTAEEARLGVSRAEAALQRARSTQAAEAARTRTVRDHLDDARLRAPFAGIVAMRYRDAGNRVEAGAPIVRIDGHGGMRLRFAVPPELARLVTVAAEVTATVDTMATPVSAVIKQVSPTLDPASGMVFVEAELTSEQGSGQLRAGLAAWVQL